VSERQRTVGRVSEQAVVPRAWSSRERLHSRPHDPPEVARVANSTVPKGERRWLCRASTPHVHASCRLFRRLERCLVPKALLQRHKPHPSLLGRLQNLLQQRHVGVLLLLAVEHEDATVVAAFFCCREVTHHSVARLGPGPCRPQHDLVPHAVECRVCTPVESPKRRSHVAHSLPNCVVDSLLGCKRVAASILGRGGELSVRVRVRPECVPLGEDTVASDGRRGLHRDVEECRFGVVPVGHGGRGEREQHQQERNSGQRL
jgi:hypothetical protein